MPWVEVFGVFLVCHLAGDFLLQTEWQAEHKRGGLGPDPVGRRALVSHVASYMLVFVPALIWLSDDIGWGAVAIAALIAVIHLVQDDGRIVIRYISVVKKTIVTDGSLLFAAVDQSFHVLTLFFIALIAGS